MNRLHFVVKASVIQARRRDSLRRFQKRASKPKLWFFYGQEWITWDCSDTEAVIAAWDFRPEQIEMLREDRDEMLRLQASGE